MCIKSIHKSTLILFEDYISKAVFNELFCKLQIKDLVSYQLMTLKVTNKRFGKLQIKFT